MAWLEWDWGGSLCTGAMRYHMENRERVAGPAAHCEYMYLLPVCLQTDGRQPSGAAVDSARQNLASSFVNGFVNAGFGQDKLVTVSTEVGVIRMGWESVWVEWRKQGGGGGAWQGRVVH